MSCQCFGRYNLKGVLLDSFQAFTPCPTSAEEVAAFVRQVREFAQQYRLHVWIVNHASSRVTQQDLLTIWADITISLKRTTKVCSKSFQNDSSTSTSKINYLEVLLFPGRGSSVKGWEYGCYGVPIAKSISC